MGRWGQEVWSRGWGESAALAEGARFHSGGIRVGGVRGGGSHSVTAGGQLQE